MSELAEKIAKITDDWNYEIVWLECGVEKHYRTQSDSAVDAVTQFAKNNKVPDAFGVLERDDES